MTRNRPFRRALLVTVLVALAAVAASCGGRHPESPVDADGAPLSTDDPDRYLPPLIARYKVGKLPPMRTREIFDHSAEYGFADMVSAYTGATIGRNALPYGFVNIVETSSPDALDLNETVVFATGPGEVVRGDPIDISGIDVGVGVVYAPDGRFEYAAWQPTAEMIVTVVANETGMRLGVDPVDGMREVIEWARS